MTTWTYWTGPKPKLVEACLKTSVRHNNTRVLDQADVKAMGYDGPLDLPPWAQADLIRLWLLSEYGGAWIDADVICLKPLDMHKFEGPLVCFGNGKNPLISNAIMFARDKEFMGKLYAEALQVIQVNKTFGSVGQQLLARHKSEITVLERWRYMPIPWTHVDQFKTVRRSHWDVFNPNACCYHVTSKGLQGFFDDNSFLHFLLDTAGGLVRPRRAAAIARRARELTSGVEVGVYRADTSRVVLQQCPNLTLHLVDPWERTHSRSYEQSGDDKARIDNQAWAKIKDIAQRRVKWADSRAILVSSTSLEASKQFDDKSIDFVFIDADHSYSGVSQDIDAWLPKARVWIGGHDYSPRWPGVVRAVKERFSTYELDEDNTWFHYLGNN